MILTLQFLSGDIEGYSYKFDHDNKPLDRDLKFGPSV